MTRAHKVNYESNLISAICLIPSIFCFVFVFSRFNTIGFVVCFVLFLVVTDVMYRICVLRAVKYKVKTWQRYWATFILQVAVWFLCYLFSKIN